MSRQGSPSNLNNINITDQFYHEFLAAPPSAPLPMSPKESRRNRREALSPVKTNNTNVFRSQKIAPVPVSPRTMGRPQDTIDEEAQRPPTMRKDSGHIASRSQDTRKGSASSSTSNTELRSRSQSQSQTAQLPMPQLPAPSPSTAPSERMRTPTSPATALKPSGGQLHPAALTSSASTVTLSAATMRKDARPLALRSTSAIASKPSTMSISTYHTARPSTGRSTSNPGAAKSPRSPNSNLLEKEKEKAAKAHTPIFNILDTSAPRPAREGYTAFPSLPSPPLSPSMDIPMAPTSGMYWSRAPTSGVAHTALRAHTTTLIGSNIYIFGGCDSTTCFNTVYAYECDSYHWSKPLLTSAQGLEGGPPPLRAMTTTAVGKKLVIFGGGDGPAYYSDVWVLDTVNFRWSKPSVVGTGQGPSKRRAHTACLYRNGIYIFGGGDGVRALNDVWRLDVSELSSGKVSWKLISGDPARTAPAPPTKSGGKGTSKQTNRDLRPKPRGYHTANIVGSKLIIFGGSDGDSCFSDVWLFDIATKLWTPINTPVLSPPSSRLPGSQTSPAKGEGVKDEDGGKKEEEEKKLEYPRLSHTSTLVGSYLFVIGGHDGIEYSNNVLCLNLVTMTWDKRKVYGRTPAGRGYHGAVLCDGRVIVVGGFDGGSVFDDVWNLELGGCAYYSQISCFSIEV